jgi:hypothetical protein
MNSDERLRRSRSWIVGMLFAAEAARSPFTEEDLDAILRGEEAPDYPIDEIYLQAQDQAHLALDAEVMEYGINGVDGMNINLKRACHRVHFFVGSN